MGQVLSFRDLDVWQAAMNLVLGAYAAADRLPVDEQFELSRQIRRAAVSIPSNVAEGHASGKNGRYLQHVRIALGSLAELDTQLEIALRLGLIPSDALAETRQQLLRTRQLLHGLARALRSRQSQAAQ